jgi:hypothetical protein
MKAGAEIVEKAGEEGIRRGSEYMVSRVGCGEVGDGFE